MNEVNEGISMSKNIIVAAAVIAAILTVSESDAAYAITGALSGGAVISSVLALIFRRDENQK